MSTTIRINAEAVYTGVLKGIPQVMEAAQYLSLDSVEHLKEDLDKLGKHLTGVAAGKRRAVLSNAAARRRAKAARRRVAAAERDAREHARDVGGDDVCQDLARVVRPFNVKLPKGKRRKVESSDEEESGSESEDDEEEKLVKKSASMSLDPKKTA